MNASTPVVVLTPDHRQLQIAKQSAAPAAKPALASRVLHPIHRALAWAHQLAGTPGLNRVQLARQKSVTPGTVTHHLKLLQLAAPIQSVLINLKTPSDLMLYSLNRMKALAGLPAEEQWAEFSRLQKQTGLPPTTQTGPLSDGETDQAA